MNNREWLYSLDVADLADWFDAEHVETKERALDGDTAALNARIADLEAQVYELTADCDMLENERDNLEAKCDGWKKHVMAIENAYNEALRWRDEYCSKFGKCLDYADAIHALMDDEGMA